MKTRLIFVRHAEAEGNVNRVFHGWTDGNITEKGHEQAKRVAKRLEGEPIDVLYSSSAKRTLATAGYISKIIDLPIIQTDNLKEINGGDWEGVEWSQLPEMWPEEYHTWENVPHIHQMPNGESMSDFQKRLIEEVQLIIEKEKGKVVCIVTHGTAIKTLMCHFKHYRLEEMFNIPWYDNTSVTEVEFENGSFTIIREGDANHLSKEMSTIKNQEWWQDYIDKLEVSNENSQLVSWLFETDAVRVCPQDKPFWYTSGSIGPYYINTHFLYGSEAKANELLSYIDANKEQKLELPSKLRELTLSNYKNDKIFNGLMELMCDRINANIDVNQIDYISGGERRDWFFSFVVAEMLQKPHIAIYKDMSVVITDCKGNMLDTPNTENARVLHIADLITEASSYERAWLPAIKALEANIIWSMVVVDRKQGGGELLQNNGVKSYALIDIDVQLFKNALALGLINDSQFLMLSDYISNPKECMRNFLVSNPEFLKEALASDNKTAERARLCIDKNIY